MHTKLRAVQAMKNDCQYSAPRDFELQRAYTKRSTQVSDTHLASLFDEILGQCLTIFPSGLLDDTDFGVNT